MAEINEAINDGGEALSVGQKLAQARLAQHLSIEQVARYLRLSESVVRALESDSASNEIPATYFRGYLRAYAKLLNIEIEAPITKTPSNVSNSDNTIVGIQSLQSLPQQYAKARALSLKTILSSLLLLGVVGGGFYWWRSGFVLPEFFKGNASVSSNKPVNEAKDVVRGEVALNIPADTVATQLGSDVQGSEPVAETNEVLAHNAEADKKTETKNVNKETEASADIKTAIRTTAIDVSRGGETLEFVFVEDCWVRVTDAQGEVLAVGIKRTGQRFVVAGPAPLKIDLGNPTGVQLKHNNRDVDLSVYPGGRPARLTIEATKFE